MERSRIFILSLILIMGMPVMLMSVEMIEGSYEYRTVTGSLYHEGSAEGGLLVFDGDDGVHYLIENERKNDELSKLRGIPLVVTGKVTSIKNNPLYEASIRVLDYNTFYPKYVHKIEKAHLLGELREESRGLVLITPDQQLVFLDCELSHPLSEYIGDTVLLTGSLLRMGEYTAEMELTSYRVVRENE